MSNFWRAVDNIRGSALPIAVKTNKSLNRTKLFVCVYNQSESAYADNCADAVDMLLIIFAFHSFS